MTRGVRSLLMLGAFMAGLVFCFGLVLIQAAVENDRKVLRCCDLDRNIRTKHDLRGTLCRLIGRVDNREHGTAEQFVFGHEAPRRNDATPPP